MTVIELFQKRKQQYLIDFLLTLFFFSILIFCYIYSYYAVNIFPNSKIGKLKVYCKYIYFIDKKYQKEDINGIYVNYNNQKIYIGLNIKESGYFRLRIVDNHFYFSKSYRNFLFPIFSIFIIIYFLVYKYFTRPRVFGKLPEKDINIDKLEVFELKKATIYYNLFFDILVLSSISLLYAKKLYLIIILFMIIIKYIFLKDSKFYIGNGYYIEDIYTNFYLIDCSFLSWVFIKRVKQREQAVSFISIYTFHPRYHKNIFIDDLEDPETLYDRLKELAKNAVFDFSEAKREYFLTNSDEKWLQEGKLLP